MCSDDASATVDSGLCTPIFPGCTDPSALSFDPRATEHAEAFCRYDIAGCTLPQAVEVHATLAASCGADAADAYAARARAHFSFASHFADKAAAAATGAEPAP